MKKLKGKTKNRNKKYSIMLVPHTSDRPKTMSFSLFQAISVLSVVLIIVISLSLWAGWHIYKTFSQVQMLKSENSSLVKSNKEQTAIINDQANDLMDKNLKIQNFDNIYNDIIDKYLNKSSSEKISRGYNDSDSFMGDLDRLRAILTSLNVDVSDNGETKAAIDEKKAKLQKVLDSFPNQYPVSARITSGFGVREDPFDLGSKIHEGVDFGAAYGASIHAAAKGVVTFAGPKSGYGNCVIIQHPNNGLSTLYGHCSMLLVKVGQEVKKRQIIAKVGSTGRSTGSHLHFEVHLNGNPVNPLKYLGK